MALADAVAFLFVILALALSGAQVVSSFPCLADAAPAFHCAPPEEDPSNVSKAFRPLFACTEDVSSVSSILAAAVLSPPQMHSRHPGCQATLGPKLDPLFVERIKPCGHLSRICTDLPLIEANKDYPGGGTGRLLSGQDYLVQFDVGIHPVVARDILRGHLGEIDSLMGPFSSEERCFEVVVTGGSNWGDLGLEGGALAKGAYDCMGGCGPGCWVRKTASGAGSWDCLKHDVCSAWKAARTRRPTKGFCADPDCGDEAAMTIYNCWRGFRFFGGLGGSNPGPFAEPAVCERGLGISGCWNHARWFLRGRCGVFMGWSRGQGIPESSRTLRPWVLPR